MEAKKSNQISIKLNGSHMVKRESRTTQQAKADRLTSESEQPPVQRIKPNLSRPEVVTIDPDEDALSRLNELRQRTQTRGSYPQSESASKTSHPITDEILDDSSVDLNNGSLYDADHLAEESIEQISFHQGPIIELDEPSSEPAPRFLPRMFQSGLSRRALPPFTRSDWFRMMISSIGAVSLGLIFGFGVLMVFKQEQIPQSYKSVLGGTLQLPSDQSADSPTQTDHNESSASTANTALQGGQGALAQAAVSANLALPEQKLFLAQAGVFSDAASAQPVIDTLSKQGFPHFLYPMDGKQHLFVAMAPTRDEILGIADFLKNNHLDIYVKEVVIPALEQEVQVSKSLVNADPKASSHNQVETFLVNGFEVVKSLSAHSSKVLNQESSAQPISADEENQLRELHRKFVDQGRVVLTGVPAEWQPYFKNMTDGLNQAITAMNELKSSNSKSYAWQTQNGVFQYIANYVEWSNQIKEKR
ncbi:hypothetical protein ACQCN2_02320 [Brevibacillus ginsengisoli]|uniref:hypothetical protein n=1 Tax=Brevibacillus ginsengisoli TaxID=363854 RepID=UPI003CEB3B30